MAHNPEILKTYNQNCDLLSFVNSVLYFDEILSSLSTMSVPNFYKQAKASNVDSFTILVNKQIPKTYRNLNDIAEYFI